MLALARERRHDVRGCAPCARGTSSDLLEARWRVFTSCFSGVPGQAGAPFDSSAHVLGAELDQVVLERRLVLQVLLAACRASDSVERRLRDEEVPALDELLELPVEERQQQRPDVRAVDVGVAS